MLARMVPPPVRLRATLLLDATGTMDCDPAIAAAAAELGSQGERVLSVRSGGTWLGDRPHAPAGRDPLMAAAMAELETEATAVVAAMTVGQVLQRGLPWLHVDEVRLLAGPGPVDRPRLRACIDLLAPHVADGIVVDEATAALLGNTVLHRFANRIRNRGTS
jgi:hypothetical protein